MPLGKPQHQGRLSKGSQATATIRRISKWYVARQASPGAARIPYYCDPARVGHFAVACRDLAVGDDATLLRLFITMAMYQARRDTLIMSQQKAMARTAVAGLTSSSRLRALVNASACVHLRSGEAFDGGCSVYKVKALVTCREHSDAACHVKDATGLLRRTGDMGKLPTSAWLHFWRNGRLALLLREVLRDARDPTARADLLVTRFARVHRVGRKLATMFVSALSTPALAPGLTPWHPAIDGASLVVVDTNVARAVDALRPTQAPRTYSARAAWLRVQAANIDLREFQPNLPSYAPRLVQEAVYAFCSKSNRNAHGDTCGAGPCRECPSTALCPFANRPVPGALPARVLPSTRAVTGKEENPDN